MTRDRGWIVGQFVLAAVLVATSTVFILGEPWFGRLGFGTFFVWGVAPGAALSFVVNALVMRRHGVHGLPRYEKVILVIQVVALALVVASIVASEMTAMFALMYGAPLYILLAIVTLGAAVERNGHLSRRSATTNAPSAPADRPR